MAETLASSSASEAAAKAWRHSAVFNVTVGTGGRGFFRLFDDDDGVSSSVRRPKAEMDRDEGKYLATSFSLYAGSDGSNGSLAFEESDDDDDLALLWTRVFCILQKDADGGRRRRQ